MLGYPGVVRSYGQFCGVARALDVIGDRWSLLIVRELLIRDCRWTDLRAGLPGVATNLLADRLRELEAHGLVEHDDAAVPVYRITPRGRELAPVLRELARWAMPLMEQGPGDDAARAHWLVVAADAILADRGLAPMRIAIEAPGEPLTVDVAADGTVHTTFGAADDPDVRLTGEPAEVMLALAALPGGA